MHSNYSTYHVSACPAGLEYETLNMGNYQLMGNTIGMYAKYIITQVIRIWVLKSQKLH